MLRDSYWECPIPSSVLRSGWQTLDKSVHGSISKIFARCKVWVTWLPDVTVKRPALTSCIFLVHSACGNITRKKLELLKNYYWQTVVEFLIMRTVLTSIIFLFRIQQFSASLKQQVKKACVEKVLRYKVLRQPPCGHLPSKLKPIFFPIWGGNQRWWVNIQALHY